MDLFSKRFRERRGAAGLSQEDIAAVCRNLRGEGMSRAAVAQWEASDESKRTRPDFDNLVSAARKMGASIDYLVGLVDDPVSSEFTLSHEALRLAREWDKLSRQKKDAVLKCIGLFATTESAAKRSYRPKMRGYLAVGRACHTK